MRSDAWDLRMIPSFHFIGGFNTPKPNFEACALIFQHRYEEDAAIRRIQQARLDSLQVQIRDLVQQPSELSEQLTKVANGVTDLFHQIGNCLQYCKSSNERGTSTL